MQTRLFHAIVVVGASLGGGAFASGCMMPPDNPMGCPTSDDAGAGDSDAAPTDAHGHEAVPTDATAPDGAPCEPGWNPTK